MQFSLRDARVVYVSALQAPPHLAGELTPQKRNEQRASSLRHASSQASEFLHAGTYLVGAGVLVAGVAILEDVRFVDCAVHAANPSSVRIPHSPVIVGTKVLKI